jgi:hypothetical protein
MMAVKLPVMVVFVENVTVSLVPVAAVTVPMAPLLNKTVLLEGVVLKPNPLMMIELAVRARLLVLAVTIGLTTPTWIAVGLLAPLVVTIAVKFPAAGRVEKVTVNAVDVALVTVPTAPLLKTTRLFNAVVSNPVPAIVTVLASAARLLELTVTVGTNVATWTAVPLLKLLVVTTAVRFPAVGGVVIETVNWVAVAAVTFPTAPLLNTTVLFPGVVLNPNPRMVRVVVDKVIAAVLEVTDGITFATCTALPLEMELVVTTAVKLPTVVGFVSIRTVSDVVVAAVTVPTAPLLNTTVFREAIGSKPKPEITKLVALLASVDVLTVTTGLTLAIWTAAPLVAPLTVTTAVNLPAVAGLTEKAIVSKVDVAEDTVPTAPLLKTTVLRDAVVSNPEPAIVMVAAVAARFAVVNVTTGASVATWIAIPELTPLIVTTAVKLPAVGRVEKFTVNAVAVADATVPTAPLLKTTVLLEAVVSNRVPAITIVFAVRARLAVDAVTVGRTEPTWTGSPLLTELVVTTAVKFPRLVGRVVKFIVSDVAVAAVTVPTAPRLNATVLFPATALKPTPLIVSVDCVTVRLVVLLVMVGTTLATWTAAPLATLFVVTWAVKLPIDLGLITKLTVSVVLVDATTVPVALLLNVTVFRLGVASNPNPLMVMEAALGESPAELLVMTGTTFATSTAAQLFTPLVVTIAVKLPAAGFVVKETVSAVAVALVTFPTAPLLKTTVLFVAVVSKPSPLMVIVAASPPWLVELAVTTGLAVATWTAEPLDMELVVTDAVRLPREVGLVPMLTVNAVAVADVTVPTAPLLKVTVLLEAVVLKANPLITILVALIGSAEVLTVTDGSTRATCTGAPLDLLFVVTTAVILPTLVGRTESVTVRVVAVAAVTVPVAPLLRATVLLLAVVSNPTPVIVRLVPEAARSAVLAVTTGVTDPIWIAVPLSTPLEVTMTVRTPAFGLVE